MPFGVQYTFKLNGLLFLTRGWMFLNMYTYIVKNSFFIVFFLRLIFTFIIHTERKLQKDLRSLRVKTKNIIFKQF